MQHINSPAGATLSYDVYGDGPNLVLVHGSFSDHLTNWELVKPLLAPDFTVHAVARRGRGETTATEDHSLEDESADVAALLASIAEPAFLLGHSYGARVALGAAAAVPDRVRKLILYEPPLPATVPPELLARLEELAAEGSWEEFAATFFREGVSVPPEELDQMRASEAWPPIVDDARASLGDLRALFRSPFDPEQFPALQLPVLLQIGTESPRDAFATDLLAGVLPDARIEPLPGQAHEGMTTAPEIYARAVRRFLLETN